MLTTYTHTPLGRVLGLSLLAAVALGAAPAAADETFALDRSAGTGANGALFRVEATSGVRSLVSDFGNAAQGPLGVGPQGLALEAGGTVLVTDTTAGTGANGALFRVDATSGVRSLVSDFGNAAQGPQGASPQGLALEAGGTVLVIDFDAGTGANGALFRVDAASGVRSLVSDFGNAAQGPLGEDPIGVALEAGGAVLVIDIDAETGFGALFRVDAASGVRSLVSDFGNAVQGPQGANPIGLALEAGGAVLVIDFDAGTGNAGALFRVDAASGIRSLVSDFGNAAQGPQGVGPRGLALEAGGTVLVIDNDAGTGVRGALFRVDAASGVRVLLSDFGDGVQGVLGVNPSGVAVGGAVVVPNCFGRVPTLVGNDGNNVLTGSPGADVILGRGGADRIDGRGGNDRICGGGGNDRLRGGPGKDQVSGEAGRDTVDGGTGNDRLDGGAGFDRINGGKGTDRCKSGERKVRCER